MLEVSTLEVEFSQMSKRPRKYRPPNETRGVFAILSSERNQLGMGEYYFSLWRLFDGGQLHHWG